MLGLCGQVPKSPSKSSTQTPRRRRESPGRATQRRRRRSQQQPHHEMQRGSRRVRFQSQKSDRKEAEFRT
jgi:hypothetical protein